MIGGEYSANKFNWMFYIRTTPIGTFRPMNNLTEPKLEPKPKPKLEPKILPKIHQSSNNKKHLYSEVQNRHYCLSNDTILVDTDTDTTSHVIICPNGENINC